MPRRRGKQMLRHRGSMNAGIQATRSRCDESGGHVEQSVISIKVLLFV